MLAHLVRYVQEQAIQLVENIIGPRIIFMGEYVGKPCPFMETFEEKHGQALMHEFASDGYLQFPGFAVLSMARCIVSKRENYLRVQEIYQTMPSNTQAILVAAAQEAYEKMRSEEKRTDQLKLSRASKEMARLRKAQLPAEPPSKRTKTYPRTFLEWQKHLCWGCLDDFECTKKTGAADLFDESVHCSCLVGSTDEGTKTHCYFCSNKCWHRNDRCFFHYELPSTRKIHGCKIPRTWKIDGYNLPPTWKLYGTGFGLTDALGTRSSSGGSSSSSGSRSSAEGSTSSSSSSISSSSREKERSSTSSTS